MGQTGPSRPHAAGADDRGAPRADGVTDVGALVALLDRAAGLDDDERLDILAHSLQCADVLRRTHPADVALQLAGLVHDLGWVVGADAADHGVVGARLVAPLLGPDVARLVELHVPAKRYLVGDDEQYGNRLSDRSTETLALQGGAMTAAERRDFETLPEFERALALRRADEAAKSPGRVVPDVEAWRPVAEAFVVAHAGRSDGSA